MPFSLRIANLSTYFAETLVELILSVEIDGTVVLLEVLALACTWDPKQKGPTKKVVTRITLKSRNGSTKINGLALQGGPLLVISRVLIPLKMGKLTPAKPIDLWAIRGYPCTTAWI